MGVVVEREVAVAEQSVVELGDLVAAQQRPNTSHDLLEAERLGDVVVAADREAGDLVLDRVAGRQEQHRHVPPLGAQPAGDLEAVDVGHHHVEHEEVGLPVARERERLLAAGGRAYVEAHELQTGGEQVGDVVLVVDHEHPGLGFSCASVHDHQGTVRA